ncbi:MAG: hypothetical protein LBV75_04170 [Paludibacter sp.]|jgi:hypothetical protein|nr:hypothetical protein [Paludibacter sp.]
MKTTNFLLVTTITLLCCLTGCTDQWNDHYNASQQVGENETIAIVDKTATAFISSETDLSQMNALFNETGISQMLDESQLLHTILVVGNEIETPGIGDYKTYIAKSHIANVALSPANLYNGQRILMLNGKYITITKEESENGSVIYFGGIKVKKITKIQAGYVYQIEKYIDTPQSLIETIKNLGDDYSIFREMIKAKATRVFDKNASIKTGVDKAGNSVYDSIFIDSYPYFAAKSFDLLSESLTATLLIPSNDVITQALTAAKKSLSDWGYTRQDSILEDWIFQAAFFNKRYVKADFAGTPETPKDLTSVFSKQWRTTVQQVDLDHPISMSNGVAYYVNYLKIPTNVLIFRIKDFMKWYEFLTEEQKAYFFESDNLTYKETKTEVTAWSGWPAGGFPMIENRVVYFNLTNDAARKLTGDTLSYTLNFTPLHCIDKGDGSYNVSPYLIPPGEYDVCLGFTQIKTGDAGDLDIYVNDVKMPTAIDRSSTTFHYDRGGQGYPEFYDTNKATDSKKGNYDRDGGKVGVITIGGDTPVEVKIRFEGKNVIRKNCVFHHWCLKPTKNCY